MRAEHSQRTESLLAGALISCPHPRADRFVFTQQVGRVDRLEGQHATDGAGTIERRRRTTNHFRRPDDFRIQEEPSIMG